MKNRVAIGALCIAACLLSAIESQRVRRALGIFALEKMERVFDVVEHVVHAA